MRIPAACFALAAALPAATALAGLAIKWDQAERHVGEEVTVDGRVLGVHCSPTACLLGFDPTFNRFTVVIQASTFTVFPPNDLDRLYSGRRVRVRGKVEKLEGKPEIVVERKDDLMLVHAERQTPPADKTGKAQVEILERLGDVLTRIEELTERMVATQERMETMLAQMDQQGVALATALANVQAGPPPPPAPSYGEPQPRPAFEALRTIKRGMSRNDVQRLVGQPLSVEGGGRGWSTWNYGYGRSITFDGRGRAQSLVGFPAP